MTTARQPRSGTGNQTVNQFRQTLELQTTDSALEANKPRPSVDNGSRHTLELHGDTVDRALESKLGSSTQNESRQTAEVQADTTDHGAETIRLRSSAHNGSRQTLELQATDDAIEATGNLHTLYAQADTTDHAVVTSNKSTHKTLELQATDNAVQTSKLHTQKVQADTTDYGTETSNKSRRTLEVHPEVQADNKDFHVDETSSSIPATDTPAVPDALTTDDTIRPQPVETASSGVVQQDGETKTKSGDESGQIRSPTEASVS